MKRPTDTERLDFLERLLSRGDEVSIRENTNIGGQPGERHFPYEVFTVHSQHQRGISVRHCIDRAIHPTRELYFQNDNDGREAAEKARSLYA